MRLTLTAPHPATTTPQLDFAVDSGVIEMVLQLFELHPIEQADKARARSNTPFDTTIRTHSLTPNLN